MSEKITSRRIIELLRINRHPAVKGEWATFAEVRNGTGWESSARYMDLFALNCWPSKKFRSCAYEVKIDRSDFMREILDPSKRAMAEKVAMECWFATPAGLVTKDEVPESWGLVTVDKEGNLKTMKMPTQRTPDQWPVGFVASLLRKAADPESTVPEKFWKLAGEELTEAHLLEAIEKRLEEGKMRMRTTIRHELYVEAQEAAEHDAKELKDLRSFREMVRLHVTGERWTDISDVNLLAAIKSGIPARLVRSLEKVHEELGRTLEQLTLKEEPQKTG
jgi:hypothetical protein